ncbi:MAG: hypothetical protein U9P42_00235 [Candidatus Fermentibacteria bacterium]|nr:hypothetical protein [Candidatus Fermentibacteria bacterium]
MSSNMFNANGRLNIPEIKHDKKKTIKAEVVVNAAYCPEGHNLISVNHEVTGFSGIVVRFNGRNGGTQLDVPASCSCSAEAVTVVCCLYPKKDPHQAIAFCNVLSCPNFAIIRSGEAIRMLSEAHL